MWIRTEEDLRRHLKDPASREGHAFEYKGAIDTNPKKGRGADFASSVGSLANADGGQVLLGVRDSGGAPGTVVDVGELERVGRDIEDSISKFLVGIEPRPTWQPFDYEGSTVIVVDVLPSVRRVAYWPPGEREKIMYPVRTGDRLAYMRPSDVEARVLGYGPRATRIMLEQLHFETSGEVTLFHSINVSGIGAAGPPASQRWANGPTTIATIDAFGVLLKVGRDAGARTFGEVWVPYLWMTPFLTRERWDGQVPPRSTFLGLLVRGQLATTTGGLSFTPRPA